MPELVFELGCEELPASQAARAASVLAEKIKEGLEAAFIPAGSITAWTTPRRLIVGAFDIPAIQPDQHKRQRGPALANAFGPDGSPSKALEGFLKGQGASLEDIEKEGDYVWASKTIAGQPSVSLLPAILGEAIRAIPFEKTMRWGGGRFRFSRPIRWILAAFDGAAVPFEFEGVRAGAASRGHRFMAPEEFPAPTWSALVDGLRERFVEPDPAARRARILDGIAAVSQGRADVVEALVDENTHLTEWPTATHGRFREDFMALPEPVLVTAMAKHEKMFPVRGEDGRLSSEFVFIRNGGDEATVSAGNSWVLNARFNDAKFFFDEDAALSLDDFLEKSASMTFQEQLGSVRSRASRLENLAAKLAASLGMSAEEQECARMAGLYAKADLSTGLVGELASLQGVIGGEYARRHGLAEEACEAIAGQYDLASFLPVDSPAKRVGFVLVCTDQLDKLAGYFGLGISPSGTSDPYGLRRAAGILVQAAWAWPAPPQPGLFWEMALSMASEEYRTQGIDFEDEKVLASAEAVFAQRAEAMLDARYDVREAAVSGAASQPRLVKARAAALALAQADQDLLNALSRPVNIAAAGAKKGEAFADPASKPGDDPVYGALLEAANAAHAGVNDALVSEDPEAVVAALRQLQGPIDRFFEALMVMVDDADERARRLGLMQLASRAILQAGDIAKLAGPGG